MNPPEAATPPLRRLAILFSVVVVDLIGFGVVMPVLPFYAREFGADATLLGLLLAAYALAQFVCAPLWGRLSDRIGRRPVLLFTVAGTAVSLLALGLADSLAGILLARLAAGAFAANISVAAAYISDVTAEHERTRFMGLLGASFGVGFVLGPAIGGLLAPSGLGVPMLFAAGLAALNWVFAAVALPEPPQDGDRAPARAEGRSGALRAPLVRRLCLANLAFSLAVNQLETVFAFFMLDRFGYGARDVAFILVFMAVVMGGVQGGGIRSLAARFGERGLVLGGCVLLAASFALVPGAPSVPWLVAILALSAVGRGVVQPSLLGLVSAAAPAAERGAALGAFQSAASLARVGGPLLAGALYDQYRPGPFFLAAALLGLVWLLGRGLPARAAGATAPAPAA